MRIPIVQLIIVCLFSLIQKALADYDKKSILRFPDVAFSKSLTEFESLASVYHTLSRKPTCYQSTAFSLMSACEVLNTELSMDERIDYAIRLTICDLEHAQISVPYECKRESHSSCLKKLESVSSWWISFASHYHDISHLCKLARLEFDKGISIEVNRNITLIQKDLLELLTSELQYIQDMSSDFNYETIIENQKMISLFQERTKQMGFLLENEKRNLISWKSEQDEINLNHKNSLVQSTELTQKLDSMKMVVHDLLTQAYRDREILHDQFREEAVLQNENSLKLLKDKASEFQTDYHVMLSSIVKDTENILQLSLENEATQFLNQLSTLTNKITHLDNGLDTLHSTFMKHSLAQQEQITRWKTEFIDLNNSQFEIFNKFGSLIKVLKPFANFSLASFTNAASGIAMLGVFLIYKFLKLLLSVFKLPSLSPIFVLIIIGSILVSYKYFYTLNIIKIIKVGLSMSSNFKNYGVTALISLCFIYIFYLLISRLARSLKTPKPASNLLLLAPPESSYSQKSTRKTGHQTGIHDEFQTRYNNSLLGISESQWFLNDQRKSVFMKSNQSDDIKQQKAWWE